ncbi:MAG: CotH kinase family protein [Verrucomicrobia bacterium]|nr:CotH kinase family protein [Verrucomicrobiota bacterium]
MRRGFSNYSAGLLLAALAIVVGMDTLASFAAEAQKALPARVAPPKFSIRGGVYTNNLSVKLEADSPSAVIRYTLDGTEPTAAAAQYANPIQITGSTFIKAAIFEARTPVSGMASQSYILADEALAEFSSNLPLVVLNTFGQQIPHGEKAQTSARFIDPKGGRSKLLGAADFDGRGDINVRGHTSLRYPKHSFHLKTKDDAHQPLKASILGLPKDSDWILYAPYPDKTLMRDVLAYELSNQIGRYAPRTKFVEVFVNESGRKLSQRDYAGVYVFEEKIKRGKSRVDVEKLGPDDNAEPNVTGGYIFKKDHLDNVEMGSQNGGGMPMGGGGFSGSRDGFPTGPGAFPGNPNGFLPTEGQEYIGRGVGREGLLSFAGRFFGNRAGVITGHGNQFLFVEPKAGEMTARQKTWLARHLDKVESVLYGDNFSDPKTGYAAYLDPDSFIDYHLLVETTKNIDGFRFSTFYYKMRNGRIKMGPLWDWNLSFGNANGKQGWIPEHWYWPQLDDQQYSWFRRLFEDPDFAQRYVDRWGELRTNQFAVANIHARIDQMATLLDEAQARNFKRWRILGHSVWPNTYVGRSYEDEVTWMKQWIRTRLEWIDKQFIPAPVFSLKSGRVPKDSNLSLQAAGGKIYYTLDGTDPRLPGGALSPQARTYEATLNLNENVVIFARIKRGNRWSYPAIAKFNVGG